MSGIFHLLLLFKLVRSAIQYYLVHLEHCVWKGIEVTSSNYEHFCINYPNLYSLKVVRKIVFSIDLMTKHCLV